MGEEYQTFVWKGSNDLGLTRWTISTPVKQMSLGVYHSAFLTCNGEVFCCGQNSHGQLGIGNNEGSYLEPIRVECLYGETTTSGWIYLLNLLNIEISIFVTMMQD